MVTAPSSSSSRPSVGVQVVGLLVSLVVTYGAAAIAGYASANSAAFYAELTRPSWAPPAWLFGPVWTVLYLLMAVAVWLVWRKGGWRQARGALLLYAGQLVANALWTFLFFVWKEGAWAFAEILLLAVLILATMAAFWRWSRWAGALLLPYLGWVLFASALSFAVWRMNPGQL